MKKLDEDSGVTYPHRVRAILSAAAALRAAEKKHGPGAAAAAHFQYIDNAMFCERVHGTQVIPVVPDPAPQ